jgi:hypothetical protein
MLEHWKDGIMGIGLRLVEPTARRGKWDKVVLVGFLLRRE